MRLTTLHSGSGPLPRAEVVHHVVGYLQGGGKGEVSPAPGTGVLGRVFP